MTGINGDEFDELLEMARSLLGANEGASDLWDANDAVNRALRLRVGDSEAWLLKCQTLSALEDDASALASAEMALRRAMMRPDVAARMEHDVRVIDSAIAELQDALKHDPNNPALRQLLAASYRQKRDLLRRAEDAS